jgi:hypothetical protein
MNKAPIFLTGAVMALLLSLGIVVNDMRDGLDYKLRNITANPVWMAIHATETYGWTSGQLRTLHREENHWPDTGYLSDTDWRGAVTFHNEVEEITYGIAGKNSQVISNAYKGSGQRKAMTFQAIHSMRENINAQAEVVVDAGGTILGIIAHRDFTRPGNGTLCPGDVAYMQLQVDGFFSHIRTNGTIMPNPYWEDGIMYGSFIYDYLNRQK